MELERLNNPTAKAVLVMIALGGIVTFGIVVGTLLLMW